MRIAPSRRQSPAAPNRRSSRMMSPISTGALRARRSLPTAPRAPHGAPDQQGRGLRPALNPSGDTLHSLISRDDYNGPFLPGYAPRDVPGDDVGTLRVDPVGGNVALAPMGY